MDDATVAANAIVDRLLNGGGIQTSNKNFAVLAFEEISLDTNPAYLVREIIPRTGLIVIWGPPKCGKSFWTFDLLMHVALGWKYRGKRVKQGTVVYCAAEGGHGFKTRIEAFRQHHLAELAEPVPFYLVPTQLALVKDHLALIAAVRAKLGPGTPVAVVIDTLNRSIAGSESDDRDMTAYLDAASAVQEEFGCAVIIVHHCGHEGTRPRGHSSITGAVDTQIAVKRGETSDIIVLVEEMKDGAEGAQIASRLEAVEVGIDEDGEPITSCVIVPVENAEPSTKKGPNLTKGARIALAALHEALGECGEVPPASNHIPQNAKCVTLDQWRDYAFRRGVSGSDEPRARRAAFQRAHETLAAARQVGIWEPYAWAAKECP
jgi:hypothetical protein